EDLRSHPLGPSAQPRKHLSRPAFDRCRITFVCPPQRFLRRDVQLGEQPPNRRHPDAHLELLLDQRRYNLAGPQTKVEAILARIFAIDPSTHLKLLSRCQCGRAPWMLTCLKRRLATPSGRPQPLIDRPATHPVAPNAVARPFPSPHPPNRQLPNGFRSLVGQGPSIYSHVPLYHSTMKMCSLNYRPISKCPSQSGSLSQKQRLTLVPPLP